MPNVAFEQEINNFISDWYGDIKKSGNAFLSTNQIVTFMFKDDTLTGVDVRYAILCDKLYARAKHGVAN